MMGQGEKPHQSSLCDFLACKTIVGFLFQVTPRIAPTWWSMAGLWLWCLVLQEDGVGQQGRSQEGK